MANDLKSINPSVEAINNALCEYIESENRRKKSQPKPHPYLYASSRRKCLRRSVYECTHPELMPEFSTDVKARFLRGEQREADLRNELTKAGQLSDPRFDFVGIQERVEIHDRKGRLIISGMIDGKMAWQTHDIWPAEIKAWHTNIVDRLETFEDLCNISWTWSGAHQLLSYLYATNSAYGVLILDRSGLPKLIPVSLEANLERMESFLKDAEIVVDHIENKSLPDYIMDTEECAKCPYYGNTCNPPFMSGAGAQVITDPEVEQMLERRNELEEAATEYDHIDKAIKKKFYKAIEMAIAGKFLLEGKYEKYTSYEYPKDIKDKYRKVDPKGKYTLKITKIS